MFSQIRTSKTNKEVVTQLTRRLNLGAENVIARIAIAHSIASDIRFDVNDIQNSSGKEYSKSVLFGEYYDSYIGMICVNYDIYKTDKNISKYIKMHLDHGLESINQEMVDRPNIDGFEFIKEHLGY